MQAIVRSLCLILLVASMTAVSGCWRPQPGTWWGVRHVREALSDDEQERELAAKRTWTNESLREQPRSAPPPEQPKDTDFTRAVKLVKEHRFSEAKALLEGVVERHPNYAEAYRWLGDCHYNLLELPESIEAYGRARELDPDNYFALRGKGFAFLHYGHQQWNQKNYDAAHENYKRALETLQQCLRLFPADSEAMYGRAMAAEGATRKLYGNAIRLKRAGDDARAEVMARNCLEVIDEGIKASSFRINVHLEEVGPRALAGGLFLRRAMLLKEFDRIGPAMQDLRKASETQKSILREIDENNLQARRELEKCERLMQTWQAEA